MTKYHSSPRFLNREKIELEECRPDPNDVYRKPKEALLQGSAIKATDIPPDTTVEEILLYFENCESGSEVINVDFNSSTDSAVIVFKEDSGIQL